MPRNPPQLIVVGHGAAGLAAAVSAAEQAHSGGLPSRSRCWRNRASVTPAATRAGRPRTCGSMRPTGSIPVLSTKCCAASGGLGDRGYFRALADQRDRDDFMAARTRRRIRHAAAIISAPVRRGSSRSAAAAPSSRSCADAAKRAGVKVLYDIPVTRSGDVGGASHQRRRGPRAATASATSECRCRHSRHRRIPGERRDDARAFRAAVPRR